MTRTAWTPAARYIADFPPRTATLTLDIVPAGEPGAFKLFYKDQPLPEAKVEVIALSGWARQVTGRVQDRPSVEGPLRHRSAPQRPHAGRT